MTLEVKIATLVLNLSYMGYSSTQLLPLNMVYTVCSKP